MSTVSLVWIIILLAMQLLSLGVMCIFTYEYIHILRKRERLMEDVGGERHTLTEGRTIVWVYVILTIILTVAIPLFFTIQLLP